jgi:hypothetical protein
MAQSAQAAQFQEALAFFNSSESANLQSLLTDHPTVNRSGRCVKVYGDQSVERRAYVSLPKEGSFGRSLFVGFEFFDDQSSDQMLIKDAETTYQKYWGTLYDDGYRVLQSAYSNQSANHFNEYRTQVTVDGDLYLIRKYFADQGVFGPNRRMYIAAFEPIEFCWVKLR